MIQNLNINFDKDTKNILQTILNDEILLRYLTIPPEDSSHDVTQITANYPSITQNKTIQERFNEYYLTNSIFVNWAKSPNTTTNQKGVVCFYVGICNIEKYIDYGDYIFDIYLPFEWHKLSNVGFKVSKRIVELFKHNTLFGSAGKTLGDEMRPIPNIEGYVGYRIIFKQFNLTGS